MARAIQTMNTNKKRISRASVLKMGIAEDCAEIFGAETKTGLPIDMNKKGGFAGDASMLFTFVEDDKNIEIQEDFMD